MARGRGAPREHWADEIASRLHETGTRWVISTGISPSGDFHVGHLREIVTADGLYRALVDRGAEPTLNFVADDFDPLRKVYPFLDAGVYAPLVGRPLSEIPCPCGGHVSYADHFLDPFLDSLERLGIRPEVERADRMYKSGRMTPLVLRALERRDSIAAILREVTGKEDRPEWSPFAPKCDACGRIDRSRVVGWSADDETVSYACSCGEEGTRAIAGGGKLVWRIDWPARWSLLGVTVEPFGKDHSTRGGSYDTGTRIAREVFGIEPPFPVPYEWINLRGKGDMSSSKGNVLSIENVLEAVPPETLRYLVLADRPGKRIGFDPGLPLLQSVDRIDRAIAEGRDDRALELSQAAGFEPVGVPFRHLVVVAQIARFDLDRTREILARTGYPDVSATAVEARLRNVRGWLAHFAPEDSKFDVVDEIPAATRELSGDDRRFLSELARRLGPEHRSETSVQDAIYEAVAAVEGADAKAGYRAIYLALLGRERGPRAASFIEAVGIPFCAERFERVAHACD